MMTEPLAETQLRAAKKQIRGQIGIACDSREQFALDFAKGFLHYGWLKDMTELCRNTTPSPPPTCNRWLGKYSPKAA